MKFFNTYILFFVFLLAGSGFASAQDCTVNAGGGTKICGTSYTLQGSASGSTSGTPTWTLVSKPAGAPNPVISNINSFTPNVTGMTFPGNYVFQIAQNCNSGSVTSQVIITAPGNASAFTAGPDITNIPATTGVATLSAVVPAGYTASWTYYNLRAYEYNDSVVTTNATMTGGTTATPTLTLTKKADHDIDPAYRAVLRITAINNPSCWYEDSAIVRFVPNPNVSYPPVSAFCGSPSVDVYQRYYYDPVSTSPKFSDDTANASASTTFSTIIKINMVTQPAGGNLTYDRMSNGRIFFGAGFNQIIGDYVFTLTITNSDGSTYTTPNLTFRYNGSQPKALNFLDPAYPQQMMVYSPSGSGGAVYCNMAGKTTPIDFYFKIDPTDPPSVTTTVTNSGITPPGGVPSISAVGGTGTMDRSVTVTPPAGGWRVGTYRFNIGVSNGSCGGTRNYYIHISDSSRPGVSVPNTTVCYPGSGSVTATIPLPAVYKGVVNTSYFQDYSASYDIKQLSGPSTATFDPAALRTITNTSTNIGNLVAGTYVFHIKAEGVSNAQSFLDSEYACSGTSLESDFTIFVSTQVNSNAGSDQDVICNTAITLAGNNPGAGTGTWSVASSPAGTSPVFSNATSPNTSVSALGAAGTYTFRWTITTGDCVSTDDVVVSIQACVTISGTVFNDANNNTVIDGGEAGTPAGGSYVYLVDSSGIIANSTPVNSNGTYTINVGANKNYTLHLSQNVYTIGTNTSTTPINHNIPGWVTTGENKNNNTGAGDGTPDGVLSATVVTSSFTNYNFGLKACPAGTNPPVFQESGN